MAKTQDRFIKIYSQGSFTRATEIWVDRETGVNYLFQVYGNSGGLTPLLKPDGTPIVTPMPQYPD
ncbi:MAG: xylan 1,4-beta-xylosidase [Ruminiclostridium sp.]|nr:xylan 1,4-beta-xylosidase [Ruminiclostridium sp.]